MLRFVSLVLLACAVVCGCASGPSLSDVRASLPDVPPGQGRIYFYRTVVVGAAYQPEVTLNGAVVGKAIPRGVSFKDVAPGRYAVTTSMTRDVVTFDLAPGQTQYVRLGYSLGFTIFPELVTPAVGEAETRDLSYVGTTPTVATTSSPRNVATGAHDGEYTGSLRCGAYEGAGTVEFPRPWDALVTMRVQGGQATMHRGDGKYSETLTGRADGSHMALEGRGAMAATPAAYWVTKVSGAFASGNRFDGSALLADAKGQVFRRCTVSLVPR